MEENKVLESVSEEAVEAVETVEVVETATPTEDLRGENLNDRVRVLSPGMMVAKRFFRSKLSILGLVMLIALFLFSFIGPEIGRAHV